jgi:hypothetical protein
MSISLQLYSGLRIVDADEMLKRKFSDSPWEKYDGDAPADANVINPDTDIDRLYQLGVRTARLLIKNMVVKHSAELTSCLQQLPTNQSLEDINLSQYKKPITTLFDIVLGSKGIKLATGTKLLYPFRPHLLPVIDSLLENYYWYAISIKVESIFRELGNIDDWGSYTFCLIELLQKDLIAVKNDIDRILASLSHESFSRASRMRVLESLIWYYYAREGGNLMDEE